MRLLRELVQSAASASSLVRTAKICAQYHLLGRQVQGPCLPAWLSCQTRASPARRLATWWSRRLWLP